MPKFAAGVVRFQNEVFPEKRELYERLSHGQEPEALFIACSDSRIQISTVTQTDPGELFICRNPGNIVPPHTNHTGGVTASIEFAVSILNVPHVVVCGHTGCAAMQAAMEPERIKDFEHISEWLYFTRAAAGVVNELGQQYSADQRAMMMVEQNVILQLRHLRTHPSVATRLAKGDLLLHGWIYDIKTGRVNALDENINTFVPVADLYAEQVAQTLKNNLGSDC